MLLEMWTYICNFFAEDFFYIDFAANIVSGVLSFWILSGLFLAVDLTGRPRWVTKYKVQPGKNQPVDHGKLWNALKNVKINQIFLGLPLIAIMCSVRARLNCPYKLEQLPSLVTLLRDLAICIVTQEIGFYYSHRLVHWGPLYKSIHKKHHEWTAPIGLISVYSHPLEYVISNIVPVIAGPMITQAHTLTSSLWVVIATFVTVVHHSGYHLPWLPSSEFHDFHHLKVNCNYGILGILDWLHGTDALFRDSVSYKRDRMFFSLTPASEIYVDSNKHK
jgi:methylsterol monooxygenase